MGVSLGCCAAESLAEAAGAELPLGELLPGPPYDWLQSGRKAMEDDVERDGMAGILRSASADLPHQILVVASRGVAATNGATPADSPFAGSEDGRKGGMWDLPHFQLMAAASALPPQSQVIAMTEGGGSLSASAIRNSNGGNSFSYSASATSSSRGYGSDSEGTGTPTLFGGFVGEEEGSSASSPMLGPSGGHRGGGRPSAAGAARGSSADDSQSRGSSVQAEEACGRDGIAFKQQLRNDDAVSEDDKRLLLECESILAVGLAGRWEAGLDLAVAVMTRHPDRPAAKARAVD